MAAVHGFHRNGASHQSCAAKPPVPILGSFEYPIVMCAKSTWTACGVPINIPATTTECAAVRSRSPRHRLPGYDLHISKHLETSMRTSTPLSAKGVLPSSTRCAALRRGRISKGIAVEAFEVLRNYSPVQLVTLGRGATSRAVHSYSHSVHSHRTSFSGQFVSRLCPVFIGRHGNSCNVYQHSTEEPSCLIPI